jgi:hypothetical protein
MSVTITLNQVFQDATANRENIEVTGHTIRECLDYLTHLYPDLKGMLFDSTGQLSALVVFRGEMLLPNQLDLPVADAEGILVLPLIYGG